MAKALGISHKILLFCPTLTILDRDGILRLRTLQGDP
jgi:hypothetical protein